MRRSDAASGEGTGNRARRASLISPQSTHPNLLAYPSEYHLAHYKHHGHPHSAPVEVRGASDLSCIGVPCQLRLVATGDIPRGGIITFYGGIVTPISELNGKLYAKAICGSNSHVEDGLPLAMMYNRIVCRNAKELAALDALPAATFLPSAANWSADAMTRFALHPKGFMANCSSLRPSPSAAAASSSAVHQRPANAKWVKSTELRMGDFMHCEIAVLKATHAIGRGAEVIWKYNSEEMRSHFGNTATQSDDDVDMTADSSTMAASHSTDCSFMSSVQSSASVITVGSRSLIVGRDIADMHDSTVDMSACHLEALRTRLNDEGYLLLRNVLPREAVRQARLAMIGQLQIRGAIKDGVSPEAAIATSNKQMRRGCTIDVASGNLIDGCKQLKDDAGWSKVGRCEAIKDLYAGSELIQLYQQLFSTSPAASNFPLQASSSSGPSLPDSSAFEILPGCTWLRAKGPQQHTTEHVDYLFFDKHPDMIEDFGMDTTDTYWTTWIPLDDIDTWEQSRLMLVPGSHTSVGGYDEPLDGGELLPGGFKGQVRSQAQWVTPTTMRMGDIILFSMRTVHAAFTHEANTYRLSLDTRIVAHGRPIAMRQCVETMLLEYMAVWQREDYRLDALPTNDIINQYFLLTIMQPPVGAPLPIRQGLNTQQQQLACLIKKKLMQQVQDSPDWRERYYFGRARPSSYAASAPRFVPVAASMQQALCERIESGKFPNGMSLARMVKDVGDLTATVVHDWLLARIHPARSNLTAALMYLATHIVFVQTDYSTKAPKRFVAYESICCFLLLTLAVALPVTELLVECLAVFYESSEHRCHCQPLWLSHVAVPERRSRPPQSDEKQNLAQVNHFVITLLHAYLCMVRNA
jgi:ectoine hydroxylase-related dioxygenase (phytanoyl-CoA dioxygenase family)